jgi:DNA replication protein DnaC
MLNGSLRLYSASSFCSEQRTCWSSVVQAAGISVEFLQRAENVLVFGSTGGGKTHLLAALGHELIGQGRSVYFVTCVLLVQKLLQQAGPAAGKRAEAAR